MRDVRDVRHVCPHAVPAAVLARWTFCKPAPIAVHVTERRRTGSYGGIVGSYGGDRGQAGDPPRSGTDDGHARDPARSWSLASARRSSPPARSCSPEGRRPSRPRSSAGSPTLRRTGLAERRAIVWIVAERSYAAGNTSGLGVRLAPAPTASARTRLGRSKLRCRTGGRAELAPPASFHIRSVWVQRPRRSRRFGRWIP
jgi:hypothetical protein